MEDELLNKIRKDLEKSGLSSELKACKIFENNGWTISSGKSYFDKDEEKSREIDINGYHSYTLRHKDDEDKILFHNDIHISAEVKKSEKPWVFFKNSKQYPHVFPFCELVEYNLINKDDKYRFELESLLSNEYKNKFISKNVGHGIHEAFKNPNDSSRWYGACLTSIKSSLEEYEDNMGMSSKEFYNEFRIYNLFHPIIILDGKLISAELVKDEISLEYINNATLEIDFGTKNYEHKSYRVEVVTLEGLTDYLNLLKERQKIISNTVVILDNINTENYIFS
jgi:hypothetical protein